MNEKPNETKKSEKSRPGCFWAVALIFGIAILSVVGGLFYVKVVISDFDSYRDEMCIRNDLVIKEEYFRYAPGIDAAMWCRLTVEADGIEEVFEASKVNFSEFSQDGYQFRVDWIDDDWWDVDGHQLIGGEAGVDGNFMRVAYLPNGDGTLTVYIFWFEV
jgi:hypothetical protein